jgi:hypothetical protein
VIVSPQPAGCKIQDLIECFKQMMGQSVVAYRAAIALDICILLRLSRLDKVDANAAFGGPGQRHGADVLRAVIAANDLGFATPFDDPVEGADDAFGRHGEIDLDAESLTVVVVDHVEQADARAIGQLVVHEVRRPGVIDLCRHGQRQRFFAHQAMSRLDPQVQFQFAIDPVDTLVIPFKPLHVAQIQEAQAEAPQLRWLLVRRTSQSATRAFSASSLAR